MTRNLLILSESRGKDASGLAAVIGNEIKVIKQPIRAKKLISLKHYKDLFEEIEANADEVTAVIGHARMVTNGSMAENNNNQPVIKDGIVAIHNGIICNDEKLWQSFPQLQRRYEVDTEVFLSIVSGALAQGLTMPEAFADVYAALEGAASVACLFTDRNCLVLATNTGSLYYAADPNDELLLFASERYFLEQLIATIDNIGLAPQAVTQLKPPYGLIVDLATLHTQLFDLQKPKNLAKKIPIPIGRVERRIIDISPRLPKTYHKVTALSTYRKAEQMLTELYESTQHGMQQVKKCTRCILPQTMPFITFDARGVCNYCQNHTPMQVAGKMQLEEIFDQHRRTDGRPDCIVTFSGGRDSSYGLHYIKTVLKMNPIAYSYDWGMLTDLGRRNQYRMTGSLGVEHILISADIQKKRAYIRKNIEAWLKRPDLGTVPLFMAGDKQYFYYANQLGKHMGINLIILCENPLERTDFKVGFCNIKPKTLAGEKYYSIPLQSKFQMVSYYGKEYLRNPAYINSSLYDTIYAFFSYYFIPHNYLSIFNYIPWEEQAVDRALAQYNWEHADDTPTTWRIGDGTVALYNLIYYTVAGFSENDTFRSNQIREGHITRKEAVKIALAENKPRVASLVWYCDVVGLDVMRVVNVIRTIPTRYRAIV